MVERPIPFNDQMVRALLAGTKTMTRRVLKGANHVSAGDAPLKFTGSDIKEVPCPYGWIGDRLWVREAYAKVDGQTQPWIETDYRATYKHGDRLGDTLGIKRRWTPGFLMPRAASRITLVVTDVRVERLQDISPDDCIAEGCWPAEQREFGRGHEAIAAFRAVWEAINGAGSWEVNPWVWVVSFSQLAGKGGA